MTDSYRNDCSEDSSFSAALSFHYCQKSVAQPKNNEFHRHKLNKICVGSTHGKVRLLLEKKQALTIWREDKPQMAINIWKSYINKGSVFRIC